MGLLEKRSAAVCLFLLVILLPLQAFSFSGGNSSEIAVPAVSSNGSGVITAVIVESFPGTGRTLISTEPFIGIDTQNSERISREVAEKLLSFDLSGTDIVLTVKSDSGTVDGPSAGAAFALAIVSAVSGIEINSSVAITGTLESDGAIGPVGGILEKARAAKSAGAKVFLIPKGTRYQTYFETRKLPEKGGVVIEEERTIRTDVVSYGASDLGLLVIEISNINEAIPFVLPGFSGRIGGSQIEEIPLLPEKYFPSLEGALRDISSRGILRARLLSGNSTAVEGLARAEEFHGINYFYTAANEAFLVSVNSKLSWPIESLKEEFFRKRSEVEPLVVSANSSGKIPVEKMPLLGSAFQRYSWALSYFEENPDDPYVLSSGIEWLDASREMLSVVPNETGGIEIPNSSLKNKAEKAIEAAYLDLASAKSLGADAYLAERSLILATGAFKRGLYLASILDSADSSAYSQSESFSGTLAETIGKAKEIFPDNSSGLSWKNPWALNYWKHSKYLSHKASILNSKTDARSSLFLAIRAFETETAFNSFPKKAEEKSPSFVLPAPIFSSGEDGNANATNLVLVASLLLSLLSAGFSLYALIVAKGVSARTDGKEKASYGEKSWKTPRKK